MTTFASESSEFPFLSMSVSLTEKNNIISSPGLQDKMTFLINIPLIDNQILAVMTEYLLNDPSLIA